MSKRDVGLAGFALIALAAGWLGRAAILRSLADDESGDFRESSASASEDPGRVRALRAAARRVALLHAAMGKPEPGDWLDRHHETDQSFDAYRATRPTRPGSRRTTLYVQPWGRLSRDQSRVLDAVAEMLGWFYGVPVKTMAPLDLENILASARVEVPGRADAKLRTSYLLDVLRRRRPKDAFAVLAVTTADLTPGGPGRWVFGQASLFDRVAVCSLYRQGDPSVDFTTCLRRTLKTAVHETGHVLGLPHCVAYECGMNGSGSRAEADARPLPFCPDCAAKVWWVCGLDPPDWYARLADSAEAHGLDDEARFWRASRALLLAPEGRTKTLATEDTEGTEKEKLRIKVYYCLY
jgi:archaemetzincin